MSEIPDHPPGALQFPNKEAEWAYFKNQRIMSTHSPEDCIQEKRNGEAVQEVRAILHKILRANCGPVTRDLAIAAIDLIDKCTGTIPLLHIPCCPVHQELYRAGKITLDSCFVCIRNERDELRKEWEYLRSAKCALVNLQAEYSRLAAQTHTVDANTVARALMDVFNHPGDEARYREWAACFGADALVSTNTGR